MDENKNNEKQNYLSGFDSVEQITPKKEEGNFNPTPMFSKMKPQNGYAVTPEGNFFTASNEKANTPEAKQDTSPKQDSEPTTKASHFTETQTVKETNVEK